MTTNSVNSEGKGRSGSEGPKGCPFGLHAASLLRDGAGPGSRMCGESLLATEILNPNLPTLHAEEGAKFAALARRIAPPALVAEHIRNTASEFPVVAPLTPDDVASAFNDVLALTAPPGRPPPPSRVPRHTYPAAVTVSYLEFCEREPNLLLACFYLSLALGVYVNDINARIEDPELGNTVEGLGRQFNAKNLMTALPVALCASLAKSHGSEAGIAQIDTAVISQALEAIHSNGQFAIYARGLPQSGRPGELIAFKCPMEGYLFELLVKHEVLQPIVSATQRADREVKDGALTQASHGPSATALLLVHQENCKIVRRVASEALRALRSL